MTISSGQGRKVNSKCPNCKQPNHWYKDLYCIYIVIKHLMQGHETEADVVTKLSSEGTSVFKHESGALKTKASVSDIVGVIGNLSNNPGQNRDPQKGGTSYFR